MNDEGTTDSLEAMDETPTLTPMGDTFGLPKLIVEGAPIDRYLIEPKVTLIDRIKNLFNQLFS